jgi:hypothetical protein
MWLWLTDFGICEIDHTLYEYEGQCVSKLFLCFTFSILSSGSVIQTDEQSEFNQTLCLSWHVPIELTFFPEEYQNKSNK